MGIFTKKKKAEKSKSQAATAFGLQTYRDEGHPFNSISGYVPLGAVSHELYDELRLAVPIIDAGIHKIIRLVGNFKLRARNEGEQGVLDDILDKTRGLNQFLYCYLSDLLSYGNACGEIVLTEDGQGVYGFYNTPLKRIFVKRAQNGVDIDFYLAKGKNLEIIRRPELILYTALGPRSGEIKGHSLLEGLPFISNILLKIFSATEKNFDRVGNVRFLVNYNPPAGGEYDSQAGERTKIIASEWGKAMRSEEVRDFVALGDVSVKTIGADNQLIDTQVPVRLCLEQIVAKLGIPPYLLGLSWSSTERMSRVQADILTSELMSYQNLLTPIIKKIFGVYLAFAGCEREVDVDWEDINLQDQVDGANARLLNAKAMEIERKLEKKEGQEIGKN